jgi:hypothetical protein
MLGDDRLRELIRRKEDTNPAYPEGWAMVDGALVIYDFSDPPAWFKPVLEARNEDGNTPIVAVDLFRAAPADDPAGRATILMEREHAS